MSDQNIQKASMYRSENVENVQKCPQRLTKLNLAISVNHRILALQYQHTTFLW